MKKWLFVLALVLTTVPVAFADDATDASVSDLEVPAETAEQTVTEVVLDQNGLPIATIELMTRKASYECPPSTTYCWRDDQCDAFCGGPGFGACQNGCCYCAL